MINIFIENLIKLIILFFVIFDPPASFVVFSTATSKMKEDKKRRIAFYAIMVAASVSAVFLLLGQNALIWFNTNLSDFKVAGGIVLLILGIKMTLGHSLANLEKSKDDSGKAVASIIGTPLLTGPAAISAIIMSVADYGLLVTSIAISIVLFTALIIFYSSSFFNKVMGKTGTQVLSTIMGLITLAWGINFIRIGLGI